MYTINIISTWIMSFINKTILDNKDVIIFELDNILIKDNKPIIPMINLYKYIIEKGIIPIIVTSRISTSENIEKTKIDIYDILKLDRLPTIYFLNNNINIFKSKLNCRINIINKGYNK